MISNAEETAASVLSSSFSVASSQYLKVSVWVKTDSITGHGAYVALRTSDSQASSDYYAVRMENISTAGAWEQYSFYIEGAKNTSQTLYFELGLGQTEFAENPSMGTAFFGEISCEKFPKALSSTTTQRKRRKTRTASTSVTPSIPPMRKSQTRLSPAKTNSARLTF